MLKNWTVTTQSVKNAAFGVMTREVYLTSITHKNHKDTECIIELIGSQKTSQRIALKGEQFRANQIAHRRRGRPLSSYAVEFCLTLPRGIRPSVEQWKLVLNDCCKALSKQLNLNEQELAEFKYLVRAVLHQQPQMGKLGAGDHVHLMIGKVVANRILKDIQRKQSTKLIKTSFNAAILKHCCIDHKLYEPHTPARGRRLEEWRYQQQEAKKAHQTVKLLNTLQSQVEKWFTASIEENLRQKHRQENRIRKSLTELRCHHLSPHQTQSIERLTSTLPFAK